MIRKIIVVLIVVHCALIALWYTNIWAPSYSWRLAAWLQLPIARVAGVTLTADDYLTDRESLRRSQAAQDLTSAQMHTMLWEKIRDESLISSLASYYHIQITPTLYYKLQEQTRDQFYATSSESATMGYRFDDFINRVMVPWYREQLVSRAIISTVPTPERRSLEAAIESVRKDPTTFSAQAQVLSAAYSVPLPLDRVISESELAGPYTVLKSLPVGSISDIIADTDGYHAFLLVSRFDDENLVTLQLQELFVPSSVDQEWINRLRAQVETQIFIPNLR